MNPQTPGSLRGFLRLARFRFLLYNVLPVALGVSTAAWTGHPIHIGWYLFAQVFAWTVHVMTHYCNEYFDLEADRANTHHTPWTGGSRALVDGLVRPEVALATGFVLWTACLGMVVAMPDWPTRATAALAVTLAWFYTAPPLRLNYRALGEVTVAAILNGLWPAVAVMLQIGRVPWILIAILAPTAILQAARMTVMNLGDRCSDESVGKRTISVRLGHDRTVLLVTVAQVVAYATATVFALLGRMPWAVWVAMIATVPLSVWLVRMLRRGDMLAGDPKTMTPVVFWASNHVSLIVCAALAGMIVDLAMTGRGGAWLLGTVLAVYVGLFAHRLWLARRTVRTV